MQTLNIQIVNPKAKRLLQDLAEMNLINIVNSKSDKLTLKMLLESLRANASDAPSMDEITKEVELVRQKRYSK